MGKHRKPVKPMWPAATGATLTAVSLLTTNVASHPPVARVAEQAPLRPVDLAYPPLSLTEAVSFLPELPKTPPLQAIPTSAAPVKPTVVPAAESAPISPEHSAMSLAARAVQTALGMQGVPYVYGGTSRAGVDCSALVQLAYKAAGISLPRVAAAQAGMGRPVSLSNLQPGDLIFYYAPVSHVVMYVGSGNIVEAAQPGTRVHVRPLYTQGIAGARRIA